MAVRPQRPVERDRRTSSGRGVKDGWLAANDAVDRVSATLEIGVGNIGDWAVTLYGS